MDRKNVSKLLTETPVVPIEEYSVPICAPRHYALCVVFLPLGALAVFVALCDTRFTAVDAMCLGTKSLIYW